MFARCRREGVAAVSEEARELGEFGAEEGRGPVHGWVVETRRAIDPAAVFEEGASICAGVRDDQIDEASVVVVGWGGFERFEEAAQGVEAAVVRLDELEIEGWHALVEHVAKVEDQRAQRRVEAVSDLEVLPPDLREYDRGSEEWVTTKGAVVTGAVAGVGEDDVGRHFDLPQEELPVRRHRVDEPRVAERAKASRQVAIGGARRRERSGG